MPPKNDDKFELSPEIIKRLGEGYTWQNDREPTISELAIEGRKLLELEQKENGSVKQTAKSLPQTKKPQSDLTQANRYQMAINQVLSELPRWKREIVEECIETGKEDRHYSEFIKEVIRIAEK